MTNNQPLTIINIYRHPNQFTPPSILDGLLQTIFKDYSKVLISGDFNAHHSWWGCEYEDKAGRMLAHLFDAYNLIPINDSQPTIFLSPNSRRSIIDLLVTSSNLAPLCHSYIMILVVIIFPLLPTSKAPLLKNVYSNIS